MTAQTSLQKLANNLRRARARYYLNPNRDNKRHLARWQAEWMLTTGRRSLA